MLSESHELDKFMKMSYNEHCSDAIHDRIYSYVEKRMVPEAVPHIQHVIYATRRITRPHMLWEHTQDLLELFAHAEVIRQQTISDARQALIWDDLYRNMETGDMAPDGRHLDSQDSKVLKKMLKNASTLRETYRTVVLHLCWAHLHYVRRSGQTASILIRLFMRYFPTSRAIRSQTTHHEPLPPWLSDMSQDEIKSYEILREKVMDFLNDAEQWEEQYLKGQSKKIPVSVRSTADFQIAFFQKFPLLVEWETLTSILDRHLCKIQVLVENLNNIFSDENSTAANDMSKSRT